MTSPSDIDTAGELQVDDDMRFQRRMWRIQRIGWVALAVVIALALAGVLGDGPLSESSARAGGTLEVRYGRVERHRSPSTLSLVVSTGLAETGDLEVWLDREFVDRLRIENVTPEPERVETSDTRVTYTFAVDDARALARISLSVVHQGVGPQTGQAGVVGGASVSFRQFVLP